MRGYPLTAAMEEWTVLGSATNACGSINRRREVAPR
jgi:hypothetical protein